MIPKKISFTNIRTRLMTSFLAICLIPLMLLGVLAYIQSRSILSQKLELTSMQTLQEVDRGLNNYFGALSNQVKMLSGNFYFANVENNTANINYVNMLLRDVKESDTNILNVYYGTESGKFLFYPTADLPKDFNHKTRPWYTEALEKKGQIIITDPYIDQGTKTSTISIVKTVEKDGKIIGVVGIDIDLAKLSGSMSNVKIGGTGYIFISDDKGTIIAHPQKELVGTDTASKLSFWKEAASNQKGFTDYTFEGKREFASYITNVSTGWKLVASMNESELAKDTNAIEYLIIISVLIVGVLAIFISLFLSNGIAKNTNKLKAAFGDASRGDLSIIADIKSKDEFGDLGRDFNLMMKNISGLMRNAESSSKTTLSTASNLASMAEETTASINEVSRAIEEISAGAVEQANNSQTSMNDMEELSSRLDMITDSTREVGKISSNARELSSKGLEMVRTLTQKSDENKKAAIQVGELVHGVNESIAEITIISDTISQITAQTNLLSLNASIEAARAGDAGRGFAVVADEIRKLAEQSNRSTDEIKKIIEGIQGKSVMAVNAIGEAEEIVTAQEMAVSETHGIFNDIMNAIAVLTSKVEEIKNSSIEIQEKKKNVLVQIEYDASISQETASATEQVSASTQQINAAMNEFTKYAEKLQRLSEVLDKEIGKFKLS